jgi:hypothetical protein
MEILQLRTPSRFNAPPGIFPFLSYILNSPGRSGDGWHGQERDDLHYFQWTGTEEISWKVELPKAPYTVEIQIPYINEATSGFAERCFLSIADVKSKVSIVRQANSLALQAELRVESGDEQIIKLITPSPVRPCDLKPESKDTRQLGLAVLAKYLS